MADNDIIPSGLSVNQEIAAAGLASGLTQRQAAELAQVDERTVRRWNTREEFERFVAFHRANNTIRLAQQLDELQPLAQPHLASSCNPTSRRTFACARAKPDRELRQAAGGDRAQKAAHLAGASGRRGRAQTGGTVTLTRLRSRISTRERRIINVGFMADSTLAESVDFAWARASGQWSERPVAIMLREQAAIHQELIAGWAARQCLRFREVRRADRRIGIRLRSEAKNLQQQTLTGSATR